MFQYDRTNDVEFTVNEDSLIEIVGALRQRLGGRVRDLRLTQLADQLVQNGRASSYYTRQTVQAVVRELAEEFVLANEIVVL